MYTNENTAIVLLYLSVEKKHAILIYDSTNNNKTYCARR